MMQGPDAGSLEQRVEAVIARIARLDRTCRAFSLTTPERARQAVWRIGRDGPGGALAGRTLAVKDVLDMAGLPTAAGARTPPVEEARADSTVVARLTAAGLVPVGKTTLVELAFGTWGINRATGTPRNPWDPAQERVPGGSSSGSAVAVAAGLADLALGTDTGGSIRIPAALNGLTGLKPSRGRVSRAGCLPLSPSLDTVGPMAWTVEEVARMFALIAGPDPLDPVTAAATPFDADAALSAAATSLKGRPVAVLADADLALVTDPVGEAYMAALDRLQAAGARLREVRPAVSLPACVEPCGLVIAHEGWREWQGRLERLGGEMDPLVLARLSAGAAHGPTAHARALAARAADQARFHAWLQDFAALLTPTVPLTAPTVAEAGEERTLPFSPYTRAANWLDLPALALPCGADRAGLPVSLQILGLPGDEAGVIALGQAFQRLTDWHTRRPPEPAAG